MVRQVNPWVAKRGRVVYFQTALAGLTTMMATVHECEAAVGRMGEVFAGWARLIHTTKPREVEGGGVRSRAVVTHLFKGSTALVQAVMKAGIPLFLRHFAAFPDRITACLKAMQKSTRYLQRVCSFYKDDMLDAAVATHVPALKRALEALVYSTRSLLDAAGCGTAIHIGALKSKGIRNEAVSTQVTLGNEEEEEEEEGEEESDGLFSDASQGAQ